MAPRAAADALTIPGKGEGIAVLLLVHHSTTRWAIALEEYVASAAIIVLGRAMAWSSIGELSVYCICLCRLRQHTQAVLVKMHFLPPCGHHLNPIEGFWRVMKDTIGAGRCCPDLHQLSQRTRRVLM